MKRRFIGVDISEKYVAMARRKVKAASGRGSPLLLVGRGKYPGREELTRLAGNPATGNAGARAERKHKRKTYGRSAVTGESLALDLGAGD